MRFNFSATIVFERQVSDFAESNVRDRHDWLRIPHGDRQDPDVYREKRAGTRRHRILTQMTRSAVLLHWANANSTFLSAKFRAKSYLPLRFPLQQTVTAFRGMSSLTTSTSKIKTLIQRS